MISSNPSKNVKELDHNFDIIISYCQIPRWALRLRKSHVWKVRDKELSNLSMYKRLLEAWDYLQNVISKCFKTFWLYHSVSLSFPSSSTSYCAFLCRSSFRVVPVSMSAKQGMHNAPGNESPAVNFDWKSSEFRSPRNSQGLPKKWETKNTT